MSLRPAVILTDIEGTTTAISFVAQVLFPYSRARLADYVRGNVGALGAVLDAVRAQAGAGLDVEGCIAVLEGWHDEDRKIGPLKTLQGLIWAQGYADGALKGHVYADAVAGLRRWHGAGLGLYVYSSGSVAAQKLIFGHSVAGDLTGLFSGYFDTGVGGKREVSSYTAIAAHIGVAPGQILFLSDIEQELDAAAQAGLRTTWLVREGDTPSAPRYAVARSFDTILNEVQA
jgi:enolase-phosphatase E1